LNEKQHGEEVHQQVMHGRCRTTVEPAVDSLELLAQDHDTFIREAPEIVGVSVERKYEGDVDVHNSAGLEDSEDLRDNPVRIPDVLQHADRYDEVHTACFNHVQIVRVGNQIYAVSGAMSTQTTFAPAGGLPKAYEPLASLEPMSKISGVGGSSSYGQGEIRR